MTPSRDLTAIVESVAKDWRERWLAEDPEAHLPSWDDAEPMSRHLTREHVLPIVAATLRAIDEVES